MKAQFTLKQIAKALDVSVATVSKSLNNSPEISGSTRIRVQEYAKSINYKPNFFGLNLKTKSTKTIGLIIPSVKNSFFVKVFSGIEKIADEKGYSIITCISNESLTKEKQILHMLSNGIVDGIILSISAEAQKQNEFNHISDVVEQGIPLVMYDRVANEVACDKVIVDDMESVIFAVQNLIDAGRKEIALFSTINNLSVGKLRLKGYIEALNNNGIIFKEELVVLNDSKTEFDLNIEKFFKTNKVDGIVAIDEYSSFKALKLSLKKGYNIPLDIEIIGFADGIWSNRMNPSLSTMSQHGEEMGQVVAQLLIEKLESKEEKLFKTIVINTELRKRETTKK
ncbi:LacI family DNA-binding transcriptional regulator [Flavobacterium sp. N1994]|uniref:LacI family DNA-binding transcriptional regulator n=1 Tax=Flavobacterium sp. N1994 TaxID=2986827 RepID=UPI0022235A92|nr:LacI family DNA-binding transcriptional regulator [Flavobacterium sp. N1994]